MEKLVAIICSIVLFFPTLVSAEAPQEVVGATTVNLEEARALYDAGAVFVDVRTESSWAHGHIDGAVNLDFNEDEFVILYVSEALDKNTPIVFYCDSPLVSASATASFFAASWGYDNVYYFRDGFYSWLASDYPVELNIASR